nr:DinB family protein [uncultured Holophaga sp.]
MLPELAPLALTYATSARFLGNLLDDFTPADWYLTDAQGHQPRWIVGHLAASRLKLAAALGSPLEPVAWEACFARGTSLLDIPQELQGPECLEVFRQTQAALESRWEGLIPADLERPIGRTLPNGSDTVRGMVAFLAWHEAYHLGQLGLLRRLAGKAGLA